MRKAEVSIHKSHRTFFIFFVIFPIIDFLSGSYYNDINFKLRKFETIFVYDIQYSPERIDYYDKQTDRMLFSGGG